MENLYSAFCRVSFFTALNKQFSLCIIFAIVVCFTQFGNAQIPVTVAGSANTTPNLAANYPSLAAALTDVNLVTAMTGPVTLTLNAGSSETAPPTGLTIGMTGLNAVLSATNTITIVKAAGAATTLNAGIGTATPASAAPDGILKIVGADYITIDGLTFTDGNVTNPATMEFGVALFKLSLSDGAQNNTIKNSIFNMQRINNAAATSPMVDGSVGILVINSIPTAAVTALTPTTAAGTNSNNKFYTNTINGGNHGIALSGFAATTPFTTGDTGNDIGGISGSTGNTILNFGGAAAAANPAAGIRANHQWGINISNNTINNNNGSGVNHVTTLRGIYGQAGTSANATISVNTVTVKSGGTTTLLAAIDNFIGSTAASNTVNISNNTVTGCTYATATTGAFTGIENTATAANVNMNDNVVTGNTLGVAGIGTTGIFTGMYALGATGSVVSVSFNSINNNIKNGTSGTYYCLRIGSGTATVSDNIISDNTYNSGATTTSGTFHGINNTGSGLSETYTNNTVYNLVYAAANAATASAINGIITTTVSASNKIIANNSIYNLSYSNSSTGSGVITGINHTTANTVDIYNNRIYDLTASNGAVSTVIGITNGASVTTSNIYNNLIGNLFNAQASGVDMVKGINITNATANGTSNVSFNTINLNATSSGTNFGTSGVFHTVNATPTTGMLVLRNNIVVNTSTPNGTGLTVAYRRSGVALNNYGSASNNNLFYAGTPGAMRLIFSDGTSADQMIATYRARVAPRDAASVSELPDFLSTAGADPEFLHIDPLTPTQIEGGGIQVSGITTDVDGETRNVSFPDLGADEFAGIGIDMVGPGITYSAFLNSACLIDRTLASTILDVSGVNTTVGTKPRLYFKKSTDNNTYIGNTSADNGWKFVEATNASTPFSITTMYSLLQSAIAVGDVIQYFIVAQDMAGTPNVGINSGVFNTTPSSVALVAGNFPITGTINSFTVLAPGLSGTYTIGAMGASYTSLSGATGLFNALNTSGIDGNVTVNILDAAVAETGATSLNQSFNTACSIGNYSVTIRPATGVAAVLSGSSTTALINLNGADYVTIDGLNTGGSSLTIRNTSGTTGAALRLIADATNILLQNLTLEGGNTSTTSGVLFLSTGTTTGNDNITITNNTIRDRSDAAGVPAYLIYSNGTSSTVANGSVLISGNTLKNFTNTAIYVSGAGASNGSENWTISGNSIFQEAARTTALRGMFLNFLGSNLVTENIIRDHTTSSTFIGMEIEDVRNTTVSRNRIYNIPSVSGNTADFAGIEFDGSAGNPATVTLANNMISLVPTVGTNQELRGIYDFASSGNTLIAYYNSILIGGTNTGTNASWAMIRGTTAPTAFTAYNNIALNERTGGGASHFGGGDQSANTGTFVSDNNIYVGTGLTAGNLMDYGTAAAGTPVTASAWQAGPPARDANSLFSDPTGAYTQAGMFISSADLHAVVTSNPASDEGTPVAVTTDFDGAPRSGTTPDIGADEFVAVVGLDVGILTLVSPTLNGCHTATESVTVTLKNFAAGTLNFATNNVTVTVTATGGYSSNIVLNSGTLPGNGTLNVTVPATINLVANGTYTFNSTAALAGDINNANNAMAPVIITVSTMGGNYNVGAGQGMSGGFNTLTSAIAAYNGGTCFTSAVSYTLMDALYSTNETFPIIINENDNASAVYTLTIRPNTGVASVISGTSGVSASALLKLNSADHVIIDGLNTGGASLTIENTSVTDGTAVIWVSSEGAGMGAHDIEISNTTIKGGITQNSSVSDSYGILINGSTISATPTSNSAGNDNDNITVDGNTFLRLRYGMYVRGGASTNPNTGNSITNNVFGPASFGADQIGKVGIVVREEDGIEISGNEIRFVGGDFANTTAGTDRVGISVGTDGTWPPTAVYLKNSSITNNVIHDVVEERVNSAIGIGIGTADATNATNNIIANNMLYNIKANAGAADITGGIGLNAANGDIVSYNTIYLNGDTDPNALATAPTQSNFGITIASTLVSNPVIKDNIVVMDLTSSSAPAIENAAINIPASFVWGTGMSNYNDLYFPSGNTQSNTGSIGGAGGTIYTSLMDWQTAATQDANSIYVEPIFASLTNLHLSTTSNPGLDNIGSPVAGITTDIDNESRHVSTPDMGADEFTTVAGMDMAAFALAAPVGPCYGSTETVTVTIKNFAVSTIDFSVNNVTVSASTTGPVAYSSNTVLTSGTLAPNTTMNVSMPATIDMTVNGAYVFTLNVALGGDVISANNTIVVNKGVSDIGGTYNVGVGQGGSGGFETLTAAIAAYNATPCLSSNVTFVLTDATYTTPAETFPLVINANTAAGPNTLTIKPAPSMESTITGSLASAALLRFNGADYVIIDGSNNGTSSRNLTITNTSTSTPSAVSIASLGLGLGSTNVTVKNTNISTGLSTSAGYGISVGGATPGATGADNDNITLMNNNISVATFGIYASGTTTVSAGADDNLLISGNSISSNSTLGNGGIKVGNAINATIELNTLSIENSSIESPVGISIESGVSSSVVNKNTITKSLATNTGGYGGRGITVGTGNAASNITISNNVIYGVTGTNWSSFGNSSSMGIAIGTIGSSSTLTTVTGGLNIYYNSVHMSGNFFSTANALTAAIYIGSASSALDIRNNVFSNATHNTGPGSASKAYAIYSAAANTAFTTINYNDYFVSGAQGILAFLTSDRNTLATIQTAFGQNTNSIVANPVFNSNMNLRPYFGSALPLAGTPIGSITTDILGVTRHASTPTIGAYEAVGDFAFPTMSFAALPGGSLCSGNFSLSVTITDVSSVNVSSGLKPRLYFKKSTDANTFAGNTSGNNGWKYVEASNTTSPFTFTTNFALLQSSVAAGDVIQYFVVSQDLNGTPNVGIESGSFATQPSSVNLTAAAFPIGGTIRSYSITSGGLATDVTIGAAGTYTTLSGTGGLFAAINASGLLNSITVRILDAAIAETGVVALNEIRYGCSGSSTLTIKPGTGVNTTLSGSATTPLIDFNGADNVVVDGSNNGSSSKNMTIRNTNTGGPTLRLTNSSTSNTFRNVIFEGVSTSTASGTIVFGTTGADLAGNSNNMILNSNLKDGATVPANAIYSSGSNDGLNASNSITGNNIFNFNSSGINLALTGMGNNWQITGNNLYNSQGTPSAVAQNGILVAFGHNHNISSNFVGGNAPGATGVWTNSGNVTIQGISLTGGVSNINNNTVGNITATNTGTSVRLYGIASTSGGFDGVVIDSNLVFNLSSFGSVASFTGGSQPVIGIMNFPGTTYFVSTVSNNVIRDVVAENSTALTTTNIAAGMVLSNWRGQAFNNTIYNIKNKGTGITAGQPPIAVGLYGRFYSQGVVYNNMISIGNGETNNVQYNGVMVVGAGLNGNEQYYYHNSIKVGGTATGTFSSHAFLRGNNTTTSPSHPVLLKNNILSMERSGGGSVNYAISSQGTNADTFFISNYNDLYNVTAANIGYWFATGYDFLGWQINTGMDANSVSVAPVFVGTNDLHLTLANATLDNGGTPTAGIPTDFDGSVRNILTPDIGAHEIITSGCSKFITSGADSGPGTLRAAVACAQSGEQLIIDPSVPLITLTSGEIVLGKSLIITGHGVEDVVISGNGTSRIFHLQPNNFLQLEDMSLILGTSVTNGGAFYAEDDMTLKNIRIDSSDENGVPKGFTVVPGILIKFLGDNQIND